MVFFWENQAAETCGQRVRVYQEQKTRAQAAEAYSALEWPGDGLPAGYYVLTAKSGESFTFISQQLIHIGRSFHTLFCYNFNYPLSV